MAILAVVVAAMLAGIIAVVAVTGILVAGLVVATTMELGWAGLGWGWAATGGWGDGGEGRGAQDASDGTRRAQKQWGGNGFNAALAQVQARQAGTGSASTWRWARAGPSRQNVRRASGGGWWV